MQKNKFKNKSFIYLIILVFITLISAAFFYLPFWLNTSKFLGISLPYNHGISTVTGMWDSPQYLVVANTFYTANPLDPFYNSYLLTNNPIYFTEKLPGYPLLIRLFGIIFGQINSLLIINILATTITTITIFLILKRYNYQNSDAFWNSLFFIFLLPRAFMYKFVPASEPLSALAITAGYYFFLLRKPLLSGFFLSLFVLSRPNGFLIIPIIILFFILSVIKSKLTSGNRPDFFVKLLFYPLFFFIILCGNFYLKFNHPFIFLNTKTVDPTIPVYNTISLFPNLDFYGLGSSDINYYYFFAIVGVIFLFFQKNFFWASIVSIYLISTAFLGNDILRFLIPVSPLFLNLGWQDIFKKWPIRIALLLLIFVNYQYSWITLSNPAYQAAPFFNIQSLITLLGR